MRSRARRLRPKTCDADMPSLKAFSGRVRPESRISSTAGSATSFSDAGCRRRVFFDASGKLYSGDVVTLGELPKRKKFEIFRVSLAQ